MPMFSPLAFTQALPYLPLAQGDIDYEVERRENPELIDITLKEPGTSVILVRDNMLAVPRGQAKPGNGNQHIRLANIPGKYLVEELAAHPEVVATFLGAYGSKKQEHAIALDITRMKPTDGEDSGESNTSVDEAFDESDVEETTEAVEGRPSVLRNAVERFEWMDLRAFAPHASAREVGQATTALSLARWYAYQQHCPHCGFPVKSALAGWAQRCTNEDDGFRLLFPRVEPAVIATVVDSQDRLLVQHNRGWKDPALYSVSAGFVEAGENLEHAVRRETMEETGIEVGEMKYLGSQPWPYRASLMMGFKAVAMTTDIHVDGEETTDARWVTRDEYLNQLVTGQMVAPGKATIARYMIEEWFGRPLD